jgi:hypothetical protein
MLGIAFAAEQKEATVGRDAVHVTARAQHRTPFRPLISFGIENFDGMFTFAAKPPSKRPATT